MRSIVPPALIVAILALAGTVAAQSASPKPQSRATTRAESAAIEQKLLDAVRREPDSFEKNQALAGFYLTRRKLAAAIPYLQRALALNPSDYATGYDLATALLETGKVDDARQQVRRLLGLKETGELHNLLGDIEESAGNLVGAAEEYQRAAHMDGSEENLFDWGNNLLQLRAFEPATQVFTTAVERYPKSSRLHVGLGSVQYARGQYAEAVKSFSQAADLAPADPRPHQFLGEMYGVAPELAGEITSRMARFVKAHPRNAIAHFYYAMSLWKGDRSAPPENAVKIEALLRRAVALDPKMAKAFFELGILLSDQERYPEAIRELRTAARLEPGLAQVHYRLAQAYQRTGQKALAAKELEIFQRLKSEAR
jgi:tetratricopeptide (TPR) repeat protein